MNKSQSDAANSGAAHNSAENKSQSGAAGKKAIFDLRAFVHKYGILLIFVGICATMVVLTIDGGVSTFLKFGNIVNVLSQSLGNRHYRPGGYLCYHHRLHRPFIRLAGGDDRSHLGSSGPGSSRPAHDYRGARRADDGNARRRCQRHAACENRYSALQSPLCV